MISIRNSIYTCCGHTLFATVVTQKYSFPVLWKISWQVLEMQ